MTSLNTPPPANDNESRAEEGRSPRGASLFLPEGGLAALVFGQSRAWGGAGWGPEVSDFTAGRRSSDVPRPQSGPRACSQPASQPIRIRALPPPFVFTCELEQDFT